MKENTKYSKLLYRTMLRRVDTYNSRIERGRGNNKVVLRTPGAWLLGPKTLEIRLIHTVLASLYKASAFHYQGPQFEEKLLKNDLRPRNESLTLTFRHFSARPRRSLSRTIVQWRLRERSKREEERNRSRCKILRCIRYECLIFCNYCELNLKLRRYRRREENRRKVEGNRELKILKEEGGQRWRDVT